MENNPIVNLQKDLQDMSSDALGKINEAKDKDTLEALRIQFLGRKSELTKILRGIKDLDNEGKKAIGQLSNKIKNEIENKIDQKIKNLLEEKYKNIEQTEKIDVTLPGKPTKIGHIHPTTQLTEQIEDIFMKMGFEVYYPYLIDDDYHTFESLNLPPEHPARDSWDTFWTEDGQIAITHTSSMQNRIMKSSTIPIRAIVIGRCFRNEATDARHEHTFNQVEGIYIDKNITLPDMLGTLKEFFSKFYEKEIEVKFTPDFFPFVEPGGMMSLTCVICDGKGCPLCKQTGWLEILGCGMIHPKVLEMGGIDPNTYSGFAWGVGLERIIQLKYNIGDVRLFNSGNLDFIKQF